MMALAQNFGNYQVESPSEGFLLGKAENAAGARVPAPDEPVAVDRDNSVSFRQEQALGEGFKSHEASPFPQRILVIEATIGVAGRKNLRGSNFGETCNVSA